MPRDELERLSKAELIELVLRLQRPEKTSRTSSKPPSTDRKEQRERAKPGGAKPGHEGHSRALSDDADRIVDHAPQQCPCCRLALSPELACEEVSLHEQVELPAITPHVVRHRRLAVHCPGCGTRVVAAMPISGTPFGPRLHAVATYLKTYQALSYERLQATLADLFGLTISQGGLTNLLRRAQGRFQPGREHAVAALRRAPVVASDETGVRIEGANAYHWVFRCKQAVVHQAAPTRAASVVREMMDGHRPEVWLSDRYSAQQGHGLAQQTCLAHLARDVAYALEASDDPVPLRLKLLCGRPRERKRQLGQSAICIIDPLRIDPQSPKMVSRWMIAADSQSPVRRALMSGLSCGIYSVRVAAGHHGCALACRAPNWLACSRHESLTGIARSVLETDFPITRNSIFRRITPVFRGVKSPELAPGVRARHSNRSHHAAAVAPGTAATR